MAKQDLPEVPRGCIAPACPSPDFIKSERWDELSTVKVGSGRMHFTCYFRLVRSAIGSIGLLV